MEHLYTVLLQFGAVIGTNDSHHRQSAVGQFGRELLLARLVV